MGIDLRARKASLLYGGNNTIPWTTLESVGKATVAALLKPEETLNRPVYIHSIFKSQREVAQLAREALGGEWDISTVDEAEVDARTEESIEANGATPHVMGWTITYLTAREEYLHTWEVDDNELMGIEEMTDDEVKALVRGLVA